MKPETINLPCSLKQLVISLGTQVESMVKTFKQLTNRDYKVFLILLILVLIGYSNVIRGPMFFDDEHFIEINKTIRSLKNIPEIYSSSVTEGAHISGNFYRPNQQIVYAIIFHFFDLQSAPYHIVSILLHLFNAFLVFIVLKKLSFSRMASVIAALIFLIHPIQTESVSYISGLAGPLGLFFLLSALVLFLNGLFLSRPKRRYAILAISGLLFVLALFSKENMIIFLPLVILVTLSFINIKQYNSGAYIISSISLYFVISIIYLYFRFEVLNISDTIGLTDKDNIYTSNFSVRLITFINVLWDYIIMIFYPYRLNYEKPYMAYTSLASFRGVLGIILILSAILSFIIRKKNNRLFLGSGWFFISLIPFTGIIPLNAMYLEHWLYIPLIGIGILCATLFDRLLKLKKAHFFLYIFIPLIVLYSVRTIARNNQWADVEKFYLNELKYTDSSIRIYNNLGMYYSDKNDIEKSIKYYNKAVEAGDLFPQPHHNLASIYLERGEYDRAIQEFYSALKIDPNFIYSLVKLYNYYIETYQISKAARIRDLINNVESGKRNNFNDIQQIITEK